MNRRQLLVQQQFLNNEGAVLKRLKSVYNQASKDVNAEIEKLQLDIDGLTELWNDFEGSAEEKAQLQSRIQSKIYQKQYQTAIQGQVDDVLKNLQNNAYKTISEYLDECYTDGYIGAFFDLHGQGIPLIIPLDQEAMVRAVQLDSKISKGLYNHLGENVHVLKKHITTEVSRGIANGSTFAQVAQQLTFKMVGTYDNTGGALAYAMRIARTEGHRIQVQGAMDACYKAKDMGADVVKQWDAALDRRTRVSHARVDGEIRELDEKFSNGLMFPGDPSGGAVEVVNCRCALLQRARWNLDETELETLKEHAEFFGLDKSDNFEEYKQKYLKAAEGLTNNVKSDTMQSRNISDRKMSNGLRTSPHHILKDDEISSIKADARSLSIPEQVLRFNEGERTGFSDELNVITVRGDVLPDLSSDNLRDRLSQKAVLAHEYYGHFKHHPSVFRVGDWKDEFRASYRASIDAPNLSDDERRMLMLDAYDRAKEAGVSVKYNKTARGIIYGYNE